MTDNKDLIDLSSEALVFYHVALLRGFRAAAGHLGLSKSVVSTKIALLEGRIGRRLLFRSTRDVSLTPDGEVYFESCKALFGATEKLRLSEAGFKTGLSGLFTISAPHDFMTIWLVPALQRLQLRHPKLRFNLISTDQVMNLEKNKIDLAIRVGADGGNHLFRTSFFRVKFGFYARPHLPVVKKSEKEILAWMQEEGVYVFRPAREKSFLLNGHGKEVRVQTRFQVHDVLSLKSLILNNAGVGILPHFAVQRELELGELVELLPGAEIKGVQYLFLSGVPRREDPRLDAVMTFLQEEARDLD
jgi:DNA-binding transcriptional LysR family regulator